MPARDLIVVGGSAGSIDAVVRIAARLPRALPATVIVVIHTSADSPRVLPSLIGRSSELEASYATHGERLRYGRILIAPPDQHVVVNDGHVELGRGPRENRFRPSVDVLFRTAAASRRERVVGIVLSGMLTDGTHGLLAIKRGGGIAIIQDASDALFPSMPRSAMSQVNADHVVRVAEMPAQVIRSALEERDARSGAAIRNGEAPARRVKKTVQQKTAKRSRSPRG